MSDFTYISYGAGVQSTALLVMSALQLDRYPCLKADLAIFADTGDEPQWVYDTLAYYDEHFGQKIPIITVKKGKLSFDAVAAREHGKRFASLPAFTPGEDGREAMVRRQCTREYKIDVIEQGVRKALKVLPRHRVRQQVTALLGISIEEVYRMKLNRTPWITNTWPLIDNRMTREDCKRFLGSLDLPIPRKSSCVFCPFHSDVYWRDLRDNYPKEFSKAVSMDETIRDMSKRGMNAPMFLHRSLVPLSKVKFNHEDQREMFNAECEGICGV